MNLEGIERDLIQKAMAQAQNDKWVAAKLLGLPRGQLYSRLKRHGLDRARARLLTVVRPETGGCSVPLKLSASRQSPARCGSPGIECATP